MVAGLTISTFPPNLDDSSRLRKPYRRTDTKDTGLTLTTALARRAASTFITVCFAFVVLTLDRWGLRERLLDNGVKNLTAIGDSLGKKLRANRFNLKPEGPVDHSFDQREPDPG